MANSLISADVLSTAFERYKNTFSKVIINKSCNKNKLETENIFLREFRINCKKQKTTIKKVGVGDLNLGTVGNRKHAYFFVWPKENVQVWENKKMFCRRLAKKKNILHKIRSSAPPLQDQMDRPQELFL